MLTKKADQHKVVINEASLWSMSKWGTGGSCMIIKLCRMDLMYLKRNVIIPGIYFPLLPSKGMFDILLLLCLQQMDTHPIGKQPANSHHKKMHHTIAENERKGSIYDLWMAIYDRFKPNSKTAANFTNSFINFLSFIHSFPRGILQKISRQLHRGLCEWSCALQSSVFRWGSRVYDF